MISRLHKYRLGRARQALEKSDLGALLVFESTMSAISPRPRLAGGSATNCLAGRLTGRNHCEQNVDTRQVAWFVRRDRRHRHGWCGGGRAAPLPAAFKAPPAQPAATVPVAVTVQPSKIDPFFEVRTPVRNFGAAKLPGGISITPLARGMYGVREFTAIINPPHSTILAVRTPTASRSKLRPATRPSQQ